MGREDVYKLTEKEVIKRFVEHLASIENPGLTIDLRPDEKNRQTPDIEVTSCQVV